VNRQLAHSPGSDARALEANGSSILALHAELESILRARLGARHAAYLASPQIAPDGSVTWWSDCEGPSLSLASMAPDLAAHCLKQASRIEADIRSMAASMAAEGKESLRGSTMLTLALASRSEGSLFLVGDQPVLTGWGLHQGAGAPSAAAHGPIVSRSEQSPVFEPVGRPAGSALVQRVSTLAALALVAVLGWQGASAGWLDSELDAQGELLAAIRSEIGLLESMLDDEPPGSLACMAPRSVRKSDEAQR
jgi:hypothetical protein